MRLGENASVWPACVLRGDINYIQIGDRSNIQDGTIVHLADDHPVRIGNDVTVGHAAIVHACTIEDECLIGMGAILLGGSIIGEESIVGAGAVVKEGMIIPPRSLVVGVPAKIVREVDDETVAAIRRSAQGYVEKFSQYLG